MRRLNVLLILISTAAILNAIPRRSNVRRINPPGLSKPTGYTHVVEVTGGRTIYVSGQIALDKEGNLVGAGDLMAQTRQVFENLKVALASVGAGFDDVVKMNVYMTDASQVQVFRDVRNGYFKNQIPASTLVQIGRLARPDFMIEIEAVANVQ